VLAVHADHRGGAGVGPAVDELEVDERLAPVGAALLARLHAGLTADAAALVDHEHLVEHQRAHEVISVPATLGVPAALSVRAVTRLSRISTCPSALATRTADTLYSGIFDIGSSARLVSWLAARSPGQWYGMNTVSGRIDSTTRAGSVIDPRRDVTVTMSPVTTPSRSA